MSLYFYNSSTACCYASMDLVAALDCFLESMADIYYDISCRYLFKYLLRAMINSVPVRPLRDSEAFLTNVA